MLKDPALEPVTSPLISRAAATSAKMKSARAPGRAGTRDTGPPSLNVLLGNVGRDGQLPMMPVASALVEALRMLMRNSSSGKSKGHRKAVWGAKVTITVPGTGAPSTSTSGFHRRHYAHRVIAMAPEQRATEHVGQGHDERVEAVGEGGRGWPAAPPRPSGEGRMSPPFAAASKLVSWTPQIVVMIDDPRYSQTDITWPVKMEGGTTTARESTLLPRWSVAAPAAQDEGRGWRSPQEGW